MEILETIKVVENFFFFRQVFPSSYLLFLWYYNLFTWNSNFCLVDVKVGKCSTQELMGILNPCMRQFYMKYREDANTDCLWVPLEFVSRFCFIDLGPAAVFVPVAYFFNTLYIPLECLLTNRKNVEFYFWRSLKITIYISSDTSSLPDMNTSS